jgi:hypothetical protein
MNEQTIPKNDRPFSFLIDSIIDTDLITFDSTNNIKKDYNDNVYVTSTNELIIIYMITTLEESDDVEVVVVLRVNYLTEEYNFLKYVPLNFINVIHYSDEFINDNIKEIREYDGKINLKNIRPQDSNETRIVSYYL